MTKCCCASEHCSRFQKKKLSCVVTPPMFVHPPIQPVGMRGVLRPVPSKTNHTLKFVPGKWCQRLNITNNPKQFNITFRLTPSSSSLIEATRLCPEIVTPTSRFRLRSSKTSSEPLPDEQPASWAPCGSIRAATPYFFKALARQHPNLTFSTLAQLWRNLSQASLNTD